MTNITINRATVEQALEALETLVPTKGPSIYNSARDDLRAALAQQAEPEACTWHQDGDSDSGLYSTSCGHYFNLEDGTPEDNKLAWCCYCGKKLAQELITGDA